LVKITFDPTKRQVTLESRGLDMALAEEVFSGPTLTVPSDRQVKIVFSRLVCLTTGWWSLFGPHETVVGGLSR
jgi:uncharacterized DUF497 family protein